MANRAIATTEQIAAKHQKRIDAAYDGILQSVFEKHRKTLKKIESLKAEGRRGAARALFRASGALDDFARVIADAGAKAKKLVLQQNQDIMEVMMDDDGS